MASPEETFMALGFNTLEAEVYICLLKNGPQTAYRTGKILNRATANVYKAVDALVSRGAIEILAGDVQVCKAIPIKSIGHQLEQDYKTRIAGANEILSRIQKESPEEGVYTLTSASAVLQRAKEMIGRCKKTIVADLFPQPLAFLLPDLKKLTAKEKSLMLQAYEVIEIECTSLVIPAMSNESLKYWKAQQLNLAVDGQESLTALFNHDMTELIQATYSNSLYHSCMVYAGMKCEHQLHKVAQAKSMKELGELKNNLKFFYNSEVPGVDKLFKRFK